MGAARRGAGRGAVIRRASIGRINDHQSWFESTPSHDRGTTLAASSALIAAATPATRAQTSSLNPQPLSPSPAWPLAMPSGPDASVKITEAYARMVARDAYFWAWPHGQHLQPAARLQGGAPAGLMMVCCRSRR